MRTITALLLGIILSMHASGTTPLSEKDKALHFIDSIGTLDSSTHWPNINPSYFLKNIRDNVDMPVYFFGGRNTNFCGYSALTYSALNHDPLAYVRFLFEIYRKGHGKYGEVEFKPSVRIREAPGKMMFKGQLDINHADQLWFLVLADQFKGYINLFNLRYDEGDENRLWASTNLAKFNRMLRKLYGHDVSSRGSDLIRPSLPSIVPYIKDKLSQGEVFLYLNNTILYRKKHRVRTRIPTHYVVLHDISEENGIITMTYWDYGLKTLQKLPERVVRRILYAVIWHPKNGPK